MRHGRGKVALDRVMTAATRHLKNSVALARHGVDDGGVRLGVRQTKKKGGSLRHGGRLPRVVASDICNSLVWSCIVCHSEICAL